jgi:hypothetical protein
MYNPNAYTRASLDAEFIPKLLSSDLDLQVETSAFFDLDGEAYYATVEAREIIRANVKSNENEFNPKELHNPCFDICNGLFVWR